MKHPEDEIVHITAVLDRVEETVAVLVVENDEITLPKKFLPRGVKEGDTVCLSAAAEESDRKVREKKAKDLLNEILRGES